MKRNKTTQRKATQRNGRDPRGRFAEGNPGGPGRPRRPVEREYLAVLSDALSLDDWQRIVSKAIKDAKGGNAKAREWLSRYALGATPLTLTELVTREALGIEPDYEIAAEVDKIKNPGDEELLSNMLSPTVLTRALRLAAWMFEKQDGQRESGRPAGMTNTEHGSLPTE